MLVTLPPDVLDRALGSVVGLTVGKTVEFQPRGLFPPVTDMVGGGPFRLTAGQWTDDTSMALCLAGSLLYAPTRDPRDLMDRIFRWAEEGYNASTGRCFDVGRTTLSAIARFRRTGDPLTGASDPRKAGNGSIMRLAPVVARWHDPPTAERVARAQRVTTLGAAEAVDAWALLARVLGAAITGSRADALAAPAHPGLVPEHPGDRRRRLARDAVASTGYVEHTLEAAFWCCAHTRTFEEALLAGVNLGHDADTVVTVTGQIAGARYGPTGIPPRWAARLHDRERILALGRALVEASGALPGSAGAPS
ncbi:ADP-ribosylglycohydrolase family protein [Azospirillum brasilense]|uniref:ADP-ribosylglycohydrolase family protein n=1 Tax=Azospirillum brasilense TaxID=192 RepID=UPI001EDA3A4B|nr:ADP-ribosylglycohydrolase family protein [Azospirillum brasilense]UKJ75417.1 ADP-ribosylglycohydrolase family protein [Azospirillum brasilense]